MDFNQTGLKNKTASYVLTQRKLLPQVYLWMTFALIISGITSYLVYSTPAILEKIMTNRSLFFGLLITELVLVIGISKAINKISAAAAGAWFIVYSALNGITLGVIFSFYTQQSLAQVFFITAGTFIATSIFGYATKIDLSKMRGFLMMSLIGLIIASVVNIFFNNPLLYWIVSYAGVAIFIGLTAFDTQKLKKLAEEHYNDNESIKKISIIGALTLYLDFINLLLFLLRILGGRK